MASILEDFYYGNLEPQALSTEITPTLKNKLNALVKKEEELLAVLLEKEKELFANYVLAYNEFSSIGNSDSFISGFRLGARITLGKWGILYKDYLLNHKIVVFSTLLAEGKLYQYCAEVEKQANEMYDLLIEQMKKAEGVTEELKEQDQFEWV